MKVPPFDTFQLNFMGQFWLYAYGLDDGRYFNTQCWGMFVMPIFSFRYSSGKKIYIHGYQFYIHGLQKIIFLVLCKIKEIELFVEIVKIPQ